MRANAVLWWAALALATAALASSAPFEEGAELHGWARPRNDAQATAADWGAKAAELVSLAAQMDASNTRADWVLLGDSITAFFRAPGKAAAHFPGQKVFVGGLGGDGLDHVMWRVLNDGVPRLAPRACRVAIGTNNLPPWNHMDPSTLAVRLVDLLRVLRERWADTPLLVQLLLPRAKFAAEVTATNEAIAAAVAASGLPGVTVLDCGKELVPWSAKMPDGLHPSDAGQADILACTRGRFPELFRATGPSVVWPVVTTPWTPAKA